MERGTPGRLEILGISSRWGIPLQPGGRSLEKRNLKDIYPERFHALRDLATKCQGIEIENTSRCIQSGWTGQSPVETEEAEPVSDTMAGSS